MATSPLPSWGPHSGEKLIWLHSPCKKPTHSPSRRQKQGWESKIAQKVALRAPCALTLPFRLQARPSRGAQYGGTHGQAGPFLIRPLLSKKISQTWHICGLGLFVETQFEASVGVTLALFKQTRVENEIVFNGHMLL